MISLSTPSSFPWTRPHPEWPDAIRNEHTLVMDGDLDSSAALLAGLGTPRDLIWPGDRFPPMGLDDEHEVGSKGGHGSVRYRVVESSPTSVRFEMHPATGLVGGHVLWCEEAGEGRVRWTHQLDLACTMSAPALRLVLALHDAILEQLLLNAQAHLAGREPTTRPLSPTLATIRPVYVAIESRVSARRTAGGQEASERRQDGEVGSARIKPKSRTTTQPGDNEGLRPSAGPISASGRPHR